MGMKKITMKRVMGKKKGEEEIGRESEKEGD
jgi:hypothetical protein